MSIYEEEKHVISEESANDQIDLLKNAYGLDLDQMRSTYPDETKSVDYRFAVLKGYILKGLLEVFSDDTGDVCIRQFLKPGIDGVSEVIYQPYSGATDLARRKDGNNYATQKCNTLGQLSKTGASFFSSAKMKMLNQRVSDEVFTFFQIVS